MLFATENERALASAVSRLAYSNPFLPERIEAERAVLGDDFDPSGTLWHTRDGPERAPNIVKIAERAGTLASACASGSPRARTRPRTRSGSTKK